MAHHHVERELEKCFYYFETKAVHNLSKQLMHRIMQVYDHYVGEDKKNIQTLDAFLQHCMHGNWLKATSLYIEAKDEYERYIKTNSNKNQDAIITHVKPGDARKDSVHDDTTRQTASNQQPFSKVQTSIMHRDQANAQVRTDQKQNFSQHNHLQVSATPGDKQISQNQGKSSSRRPREIKEYNSPKNDDNRNDLPDEYGGTKEYLLNEKGIDRTTKQGTEKEENVHVPADICTRRLNPSLLLRENNPKIPELSDPNRPTKLVERFSELYNNEYKDAFEELEKDRFHERDIVYHLLRVVRRAYVHCQYWNRIEKKLREVKYISGLDDEHIHDRGTLEQEREVLMKRRQDMVVQDFMENMISEIVPDEIRKTTKLKYMHFAEQCTEIIWWMCVQNPAMHLECLHDRLNGQSKIHRFNSDLYRTYTNSGEFVDFCVWSLVRLHKGGPILSKGVAQGMNK